jgi:hypothetical protein
MARMRSTSPATIPGCATSTPRIASRRAFVLRASFNDSITRPNLDNLAGGVTINPDVTPPTARVPNPNLKPERGENFFTSVEYYFPKGAGFFSVSGSHRNISNLIQSNVPSMCPCRRRLHHRRRPRPRRLSRDHEQQRRPRAPLFRRGQLPAEPDLPARHLAPPLALRQLHPPEVRRLRELPPPQQPRERRPLVRPPRPFPAVEYGVGAHLPPRLPFPPTAG